MKTVLKFISALTLLLIFTIKLSKAQSTCPNHNIDFEDRHFTGWTGILANNIGFASPLSSPVFQIDSNIYKRQVLITTQFFDTLCYSPATNSQDSFMTGLYPYGGTCSVRLGNKDLGAQAEVLRYKFLATDSFFTFHYAAVVENPGHGFNDQPYFKVIIRDSFGNYIPGACDSFYAAQSNVPFITSTSPYATGTTLQYRRWSTISFYIAPFVGQRLTVDFINADCSFGGHFGYTYLDVSCIGTGTVPLDSVYPGDANKDKVCDFADLIPIGIAMGSTGPARATISNSYIGQSANNYAQFFPLGANYKHSDCNGDGIIDLNDTMAIHLNYGQLHPKESHNKSSSLVTLQLVPLQTSFHAGDVIDFDLMLGDVTNPINGYYGSTYTLNFPMSQLSSSMTPSFNGQNSWMGKKDSNCIYMQKDDLSNGNIIIGCSKMDQQAQTGYGSLGRVKVKLASNLQEGDSLIFNIPNGQIFNNYNSTIDVTKQATVIKIDKANSVANVEKPEVHYYPNPSNNELNISFVANQIDHINILNPIGQSVLAYNPATVQNSIIVNTSNLAEGLYLLQIIDKNKLSSIYKIEIKHN